MIDVDENDAAGTPAPSCPVVAILAAAEETAALGDVLGALGHGWGACYVVVQHSGSRTNDASDAFPDGRTTLDVVQATDGVEIAEDRILVVPESRVARIASGNLRLARPGPENAEHLSIDIFLSSLAAEIGDRAAVIVLSLPGRDGIEGLARLKAAGGCMIVGETRDGATARSIAAAGPAESILPPAEIAEAVRDCLAGMRREPAPSSDKARRGDEGTDIPGASPEERCQALMEELERTREDLAEARGALQSESRARIAIEDELVETAAQHDMAQADLANTLASTGIAALFLDREARLRRITPAAQLLLGLDAENIGRSVNSAATRLIEADLDAEARRVVASFEHVEREIAVSGGGIVLMRILPYLDAEDRADGVVVTFADISASRAARDRIDGLNQRLQAKINDLSAILDLAPIGIAFLDDPAGRDIILNADARRMTGRETGDLAETGREIDYQVLIDDTPIAARDLPLRQVWRTGEPVTNVEARFVHADGRAHDVMIAAAPVFDDAGKMRRAVSVFSDITPIVHARRVAERVAGQYAYLARLGRRGLEGLPVDVMIAEIPLRLTELMNVDAAQILLCRRGQGTLELASAHGIEMPDDRIVENGPESVLAQAMSQGKSVDFLTAAGGSQAPRMPDFLAEAGFAAGLAVSIGEKADPLGLICIETRGPRAFSRDDRIFLHTVANVVGASLRRASSDNQKQLLLDELRHRVKNMLATVQSVSSLSLRNSGVDPAIRARLMDRIRVLALAHDLNFRSGEALIDVGELVHIQVDPFDPGGDRLEVKGESRVRLDTSTAIDMSMIIHELTTNAVKHGALADEDGRVSITIGSHRRNGFDVVRILWMEESGRALASPPVTGGGSKLLHAVGRQPQFDITWEMRPSGLRCEISVTT
ncbi:two-component sensor histidine kinase [Palleronia aestuarii]|uniref:histidine kinase n=1 Tax=Palleronia aestuarii TaxID=568105 RepID=A0A2W7P5X6_9RHOB|nr:chemotaxis protein CheB [Palleronia aestuarii]PZX18812.1 two-component sensor histidine kinase [Palleronia aestuarii]